MGTKIFPSFFMKIFVPVVQCFEIFRVRGCVVLERLISTFNDRITHLCFVHALNGSVNIVSAE